MPNEMPNAAPRGPLERRLERLTAAVAVLAVGFALAVVWTILPRPGVESTRFVLRDAHGAWRGSLAMDPDGNPTLRLNDARGRALLYGVVRSDGTPRLRLSDSTGTSRLVLEMTPDGAPHARLLDANGRTGVHASLAADGRPALEVRWGSAYRQLTLADSSAGSGAGPAASRGR